MVSLQTPHAHLGASVIDFALADVAGKLWTTQECRGDNGLLVMFICNHCPYVKAILGRLTRDVNHLKDLGINSVAIMSNDVQQYPEDSPEQMKHFAQRFELPFPYLFDESQQVAKQFGAVCTPDFFGYNAQLKLQYRGRLDASHKQTAADNVKRDLFDAMAQIARTGRGPDEQFPSMGCSIKWRDME